MMNRLMEKLGARLRDDLFERNRAAAYKRDKTIVNVVLMGSLGCIALLFCVSFFIDGYAGMKWVYATMCAVYVVLLVCSLAIKDEAVPILIYVVHFSFVGFCAYSSSLIYPNDVCVMVLSEMFILPTLFLDKGWRVVAVSVVTAILYLAVISLHKPPYFLADEVVNVACFTLLGNIVGSFTRRAQLENFDNIERLRISREQYRMAVEHNKGVIYEYDVAQRCVTMNPDVATMFGTEQKLYGVPYEPVRQGQISEESSEAYIKFYEAIINGEKTGTAEFERKAANGWRWQRATFTTIFSDVGKPLSAVISFIDVTEQRAQEEAQRLRAENDGLTGIYNRATAEALINGALSEKAEEGGAFLLLDLDNLKTINDTLGHPQGDAALCAIAQALKARFRQTDIVGRVGGDEFAVFVGGIASAQELSRMLDGLLTQISKNRVGEHAEHQLSASIGAALRASGDVSFGALYKKADTALYQAKKNGKNQYAFYN